MDGETARAMAALAEQAEGELSGPDAGVWLDRLDGERAPLEAAIGWFLEHDQAPEALALAARLWRFWSARGQLETGRRLLAAVLAAPGARQPTAQRASALYGAGLLAFRHGDTEDSRRLNEEALAVARAADDRRGEVDALVGLARVALRDGEIARVCALAEQSLALARILPDRNAIATPLHLLAAGTRQAGDVARARTLYGESLALSRQRGDTSFVAMELMNTAFLELRAGEPRQAAINLREALAISRREGLGHFVPVCLIGLADVAAVDGAAPRAATLLGAAQGTLARSAAVLDPDDQQEFDWCLDLVRGAVEADAFAAAWAAGQALSAEQAAVVAFGDAGAWEPDRSSE